MQKSNAKRRPQKGNGIASAAGQAAVVFLCYLSLVALAFYGLLWVPPPLGMEAPANVFSEARALQHATYLSEVIGDRKVGTANVEVATKYVIGQAQEIVDLAAKHPQLVGEVDREQTSGGLNAHFAGVEIASAYKNLTNVILYIAPRLPEGAPAPPALLLNSHFDSVFGTKGASDCGACVGVMLEVARALVANPETRLSAPLVFLFNGGEETILLAAHGFMAQSKWASRLGAFINLESTGPGGPAYVFQHTGGWMLHAYAKAARYPHGSVVGQDFFESRVLAMDTDFRMFSAQHHGSLPGIDIAYILDGAAYHTERDTVARIRKGTVQASGDNVLAAVVQITEVLGGAGGPPEIEENAVFFDFLGRRMVTYSWSLGRKLHTAPLALVLAAITTLVRRKGPAGVSLGPILRSAGLALASILSAVLSAAVFGVLRALLTGTSMIWFGKPLLFGAIYAPVAVAGLLLPYLFTISRLPKPRASVLGFGLLQGVLAAVLTAVDARSGFICSAWALCCTAAAFLAPSQGGLTTARLIQILAAAAPAGLIAAPFAAGLPLFVMEHISLSGSPPPPLGHVVGDAAVGVVLGLAVAVTGAFFATLLANSARPILRWLVLVLLAASVASSAYGSAFLQPYSADFPKRVLVQHHHQLDGKGKVAESRWSVAGLDPIPVEVAVPRGEQPLMSAPHEWQGLYPISRLLRGFSLPAEGPDPSLTAKGVPPLKIALVKKEADSKAGVARLYLQLETAQPPWGSFNMTGPVKAWSFTEAAVASSTDTEGTQSFLVRFASNDRDWPFWVDVAKGGRLQISAAVLFMEDSAAIRGFTSHLPAWTNAMPVTAFHANFAFSA